MHIIMTAMDNREDVQRARGPAPTRGPAGRLLMYFQIAASSVSLIVGYAIQGISESSW